jgi:hypothetical protein
VPWTVRWRGLEERFTSRAEALDRWEALDALGRAPELVEVAAQASPASGTPSDRSPASRPSAQGRRPTPRGRG